MNRKKIKILIILIISITTTSLIGCWDAIEIDDRGYVLALGIDKYDPTSEEKSEGRTDVPKNTPRNRYSFTYAMPNVEFLIGESDTANISYNIVGENLYATNTMLTTRFNKQIFLGHMKVVVVGQDVARDRYLFREVLDVLERDPYISRRANIAITPEIARDVLKVEPLANPVTGQFIMDLFRNKVRSPRSGGGVVGDVLEEINRGGNALIPRIIPGVEDIKVAGSAIIKNHQLQGWLGEIETKAAGIIRGTTKVGGVSIPYGKEGALEGGGHQDQHHMIPVELMYLSSKFRLIEEEDSLKILVEIKTEGEIEQLYFQPQQDLLEPQVIREIEDRVCDEISSEIETTIEKLQKEFEVDVLGIDSYLSKFHPKLWRELEKDWQEIFPVIEIEVDVSTKIRRIGMIR